MNMNAKYCFTTGISQEEFENRIGRKTAKRSVISLLLPKTYISHISKNGVELTITGKYGFNGLQPWFCCKYSTSNRHLQISGKFTYPRSIKLFVFILMYIPLFIFLVVVGAKIETHLIFGVIYSLIAVFLFYLVLLFSNVLFKKRNANVIEFLNGILTE
jgi:hypothetical protein